MTTLERSAGKPSREAYDAAVQATPGIDTFCSQWAWTRSFHDSFSPEMPLFWHQREGSYLGLALSEVEELGPIYHALEHGWRFASPCVGPAGLAFYGDWIAERSTEGPALFLLSGLPLDDRLVRTCQRLAGSHEPMIVGQTERARASLTGGVDGFLSRRSRNFRRGLERSARRASEAGVEIIRLDHVEPEECTALYERIVAVEQRSWKAATGNGVDREPMFSFYRFMLPRLAELGTLRLLLARRGDEDVGYMYGGVAGDLLRGLQFSFDAELARLGLGNLLHLRLLEAAVAEGIRTYDLGMVVDYKRRWAEEIFATPNILLVPR